MNNRQKLILKTAIRDYIETGEPSSSSSILENADLSVSSATVRNELNVLERLGYLSQLHTSSGRVPTDDGYRLYVDELMDVRLDESSDAYQLINRCESNIELMLAQLSQMISSTLDYTTIVMAPEIVNETLKMVHLIAIDMDRVLVVLLNSLGVDHEFLIQGCSDFTQEELTRLSALLTDKLTGKNIHHLSINDLNDVMNHIPSAQQLLSALNEKIVSFSSELKSSQRLYTSGASKLIRLPDFSNIQMARQVLELLEEDVLMSKLLSNLMNNIKNNVAIGKEINQIELSSCSVVMAPFTVNASTQGSVAVLGPKRMTYSTIVPMVQSICDMMSQSLLSLNAQLQSQGVVS